ncbi:MAG TPA: RHS repeat-associated core domain-containing protein [Methylomirabilota bacterium]|nr:RHS repeat-associated core domain-containing protein [Methylomirabilota bacterium]
MKTRSARLISFLLLVGIALLPSASGPQSPDEVRAGSGYTATLLPDGRWLLLGGEDPQGPRATAEIWDPRTQITTRLTTSLQNPRAWHTATVLPDGTVLIIGGVGAKSRLVGDVELFHPETETFEPLNDTGLTARAYHSTTLLTDGRVLIVGGISDTGETVATAELWSFQTQQTEPASATLAVARRRHSATLQSDGSVLIWGGVNSNGTPITYGETFNANEGAFSTTSNVLNAPSASDSPQVSASVPAAGDRDVPSDAVIALRFSKPLQVETLTQQTVTLTGPAGLESVSVVAAEGGRLLFVTPRASLLPGSSYTLRVNGSIDTNGLSLPLTEISFSTELPSTESHQGQGMGPFGRFVSDHSSFTHRGPHYEVNKPGQPAELDDWEWKGERRNGKPYSPWQSLPPLQASPGVTALAGQVLNLNGQPLAEVTLQVGNRTAQTDRSGRFLLTGIPSGDQILIMDGSTANRPGKSYGIFDYYLDIEARQTNVLPFTIWMPLLDTKNAVPIPVPTRQEVVVTSPRIPGLEVRIPANVILQTAAGPLTWMSLTQIPVDRAPFPLPEGTQFFFTPQAHGALVQRPDGSPSPDGVRFILPNVEGLASGVRTNLTGYDAQKDGWYVYGQGTVSRDGTQIIPDPGVEFHRVTCVFILGGQNIAPALNPVLGGPRVTDPVDPATGLFIMQKVDLIVPDVIPIVIRRTHRQAEVYYRPFGWGASHDYQLYLVGDYGAYTYADLMLGDGARVRYNRISPGTSYTDAVMEHTATPTKFYKSRMTWNSTRPGWDLKFQDGTIYRFISGNPASYLSEIEDRYGNRLTIARIFPNNQRIGRITSPGGRWVDFTYDASYQLTQIRDNTGRAVNYTYDTNYNLLTATDPSGGVTQYTYDANHRILTIRDARGVVYLTNEYDAASRIIRQTQADGTTYQLAYTLDVNGKIIQTDVTDTRGFVRRLTFNANGYVLTDTRALGTPVQQVITYMRDSANRVTSVTDPLGRRTDSTYDVQGNLLTLTRLAGTPEAVTTSFTYEATFQQVANVTDPLNHTTTFGYDVKGNVTSITDPLSNQTTLAYNTAGQPLSVTTPAGTTGFTYDRQDLATITDPLGNTTTRFTDALSRVLAVTDPLGRQTRYTYSPLNQVTQFKDMLGGITQFNYDANGNLLSVTDARNNATSYAYSNMDRVTSRTDPLLRAESYSYDNDGNPTSFTDRKSQVTSSTYDALGRLTQATYQDSSITSYTYDSGNRLTQVVDSLSGTITLSYDNLDRLIQETTAVGSVGYTYDAAGRRTSMTVAGQPTVSYAYDNADRLTSITQGSSVVSFAYDNANRRTSLTLPNGLITEYSYDAGSRLTGLTYKQGSTTIGTLTYTYNAAGERVGVGGTWARTGQPNAVASATYNAANHQLTFGGQTLTYDQNGNLTSDGTNTLTWDARNQLVAINGASVSAGFSYDAFSRRTGKTINDSTTNFVHDGANPVQEVTVGGTANILTGLGIDEYFTRTDADGTRTFLTDILGSTVALTDQAGALQTQYAYEAFGATTVNGTPTTNPIGWTGRELDGTGLQFLRARYYHPGLARFISEDPIGFASGDVNLYSYTWNNPLSYVDPLGLVTMPAPGPVRGRFGDPREGGKRRHKGTDFHSPKGTCIVASDDGVVLRINKDTGGGAGGNEIIVRNSDGDIFVYSHAQPLPGLKPGEQVYEGRGIGRSDYGSGSAKNRPHLHYQWKPKEAEDYKDPMEHLAGAQPYPNNACQPSLGGQPMLGGRKN